jgi:hypothetical protein
MAGKREVRIRTETGIILAAPAYPADCSYVRVLGSDGEELAYWDHQEWKDAPAEVMGAIVGAICGGAEVIGKSDGRSRGICSGNTEERYKVIMHTHRDPISDEPLFWSNSQGWVSLEEATMFPASEEVRMPNEAWGTVRVAAPRIA